MVLININQEYQNNRNIRISGISFALISNNGPRKNQIDSEISTLITKDGFSTGTGYKCALKGEMKKAVCCFLEIRDVIMIEGLDGSPTVHKKYYIDILIKPSQRVRKKRQNFCL